MHKVGVKNLINSGLNELGISMTDFNAEMYKRIYRSDKYEQMRQNVLDLLRINNEMEKPIKIYINLRIDKPIEKVLNYSGFNEVIELAEAVSANYHFDNWSGRIKSTDLTVEVDRRLKRLFRIDVA
ncbi:MAG: hypothetical protein HUU08_07555 [Candidatus Brocadia sp.]|nr:hypothetical protein [Candidatus Brocadia sp.]